MVFSELLCWMRGWRGLLRVRGCSGRPHPPLRWEAPGSLTRHRDPDLPYFTYVPATYDPARDPGLVVMLHGCCQTPPELAHGSRMPVVAEEENLVRVLPDQRVETNPRRCWNWFRPGQRRRGHGETGAIGGITDLVRQRHGVDPKRVVLVGFSAGGAMVPPVLASDPELFAGGVIHSGLCQGSARSALGALRAMACGKRPRADRSARLRRSLRKGNPKPVAPPAVLVIHGQQDEIVDITNAHQIVQHTLSLHRTARLERGRSPRFDRIPYTAPHGDYTVHGEEYRDRSDRLLVRSRLVAGLNHAWSGGAAEAPHGDPEAPPASAMIRDFVADVFAPRKRSRLPAPSPRKRVPA